LAVRAVKWLQETKEARASDTVKIRRSNFFIWKFLSRVGAIPYRKTSHLIADASKGMFSKL